MNLQSRGIGVPDHRNPVRRQFKQQNGVAGLVKERPVQIFTLA